MGTGNLDILYTSNGLKSYARRQVYLAIKSHSLPSLANEDVNCRDCGTTATEWDHRDYRYPLWVEAVCKKCNMKRGRGKLPVNADRQVLDDF